MDQLVTSETATNEVLTAEEVFRQLKENANPRTNMLAIFDLFFGDGEKSKSFIGRVGDRRRTTHETLFGMMMPHLKKQVVFGTGKGGFLKYGVKHYVADFYDEENKAIYEIDGNSHRTKFRKSRDSIRDYFFYHELGIKTYRVTNESVERILLKSIRAKEASGELREILNSQSA